MNRDSKLVLQKFRAFFRLQKFAIKRRFVTEYALLPKFFCKRMLIYIKIKSAGWKLILYEADIERLVSAFHQ